MESRQLTKRELGEAVGLSSATVVKLSRNEAVSASTLERISAYLGCNIDQLISNNAADMEVKRTTLGDLIEIYLADVKISDSRYDRGRLMECIRKIASPGTLSQVCNFKRTDYDSQNSIQAYISSFDEKSPERKSMGVYYTPNDVIRFIIEKSVQLKHDGSMGSIVSETVMDPTCGCGDFLINIFRYKMGFATNEEDCYSVLKSIYGNDINQCYSDLSKLRLFIASIDLQFELDLDVVCDILNSRFTSSDYLQQSEQLPECDYMIGNPPYVESHQYSVHSFLQYNNVYGDILARSINRSPPGAVIGFIIPISYISTPRMSKLRELFFRECSVEYLYNYNDRPDCLFTKVHQKLTIIIARKKMAADEQHALFTSGYTYWYKDERYGLFERADVVENRWSLADCYPKLGNDMDVSIFQKIINSGGKSIKELLSTGGEGRLYLNARATFWIKAFSFNPGSREFKEYAIAKDEESRLFCILNSSLFWWFWTVVSDCWHITTKELSMFRIPDNDSIDFVKLYEGLENELESTKEFVHTKQTEYEYKHKLCKSRIDEIDRTLAIMYGLSEEELEYIINYQDKYRRGLGP